MICGLNYIRNTQYGLFSIIGEGCPLTDIRVGIIMPWMSVNPIPGVTFEKSQLIIGTVPWVTKIPFKGTGISLFPKHQQDQTSKLFCSGK
jgi:hypothetical protein